MTVAMESAVQHTLEEVLQGLDEQVLEYLVPLVVEQLEDQAFVDAAALGDALDETVSPFLLSTAFVEEEEMAATCCLKLATRLFQQHIVRGAVNGEGNGVMPAKDALREFDHVQSIENLALQEEDAQTQDLVDRMWGFHAIRQRTNAEMEAARSTQSARQVRKAVKDEKRQEEKDKEDAAVDLAWEDLRVLPDMATDTGDRDIHVPQLTMNFKGKTLLSDTSLKLISGRRYGLIGKNGAGKTTLLRFISHYEIDGFPRHVRIQLVEQESSSKLSLEDRSVLEVVLGSDYERALLLEEEQTLLADKEGDHAARLKKIYDRLVDIDADAAEARARVILGGLQFSDETILAPAKSLSGGWRMRVALAGALFMAPDLLLLDEPTNHLDLEAVVWLEQYLADYDKTMIVVSHDRKFLDVIATDIIHFTNAKLQYYRGDYHTFERTQKEALRRHRKAYEAQQMKIQHMQAFIDRFRFNAKKAPLVQSRVKALDKIMRVELLEEPEDERAFKMHFPPPEPLGRPIIAIDTVAFQYTPESPLLFEDVHLGIDMSSRIGILGVNGSGKSTLINVMLGKLAPTKGMVTLNPRVRIETFTQHHIDSLDLSKSAVDNMKVRFPGHESDEFRTHLGRFNLSGELAIKPTRKLSGGQKSRVGFALMTWRLPHIVVLDEPTNHLDMETIDALIDALREFKGGVVIVSHDQHFVTSVCQELWVVADKKVSRFDGTMEEYKTRVLKK